MQRFSDLKRLGFALVLTMSSGCISLDFTNRSDIEYTRVIAMTVDPPVFRAGDTLTVRPLVVRPDGTHVNAVTAMTELPDGSLRCDGDVCFDFALCARAERAQGLESAQFSPEVPSQGCETAVFGDDVLDNVFSPIQADGSVTIDTTPLADAIDPALLATFAAQLGIPATAADDVLTRTGFALVIELRVFDNSGTDTEGENRFVAYKRALFIDDGCTESCPGVSPPAPEFEIVDAEDPSRRQFVTGRTGAPDSSNTFECGACDFEDGEELCEATDEVIELAAGRPFVLVPREDGEDWLESYTVLALTGEFLETSEQGYFSWFTNGGNLDQERTRFPAAEEVYTAPAEPGEYALWTVVRDGHYGANACRLRFSVRE